MKKQRMLTRPLAALLALVMALTMTPAAGAAEPGAVPAVCPICKSASYCTMTVKTEANCHETGVERYVCTSPACPSRGQPQLIETPVNMNRHDYIYTDNLDGTHSAVCRVHADAKIVSEKHAFVNGVCDKCGSPDYSQVGLSLPASRTVLAALGDTGAKLTAGDIKVTLGTANVTSEYELSYLWFYQSKQVGEGAEYPLPSSVYSKAGTYYYTLIVSAVPKGTLYPQPVTKTCNITLQVDELITASAIVSTQDAALRLGDSDGWALEPVSSQIYAQVLAACGRNASPSYVVFGTQPEDGPGRLQNVTNTSTQFYFSGARNLLDNVEFLPGENAGEFSVGFTAYDTADGKYAGVLTITVQRYTGSMDVVYATARNSAVALDARDFQAFWSRISPDGALDYITFDELPTTIEGSMHIGYASQAVPGEQLWLNDLLYVNPGVGQFGISSVSFVPGVTENNYVTLGFTAYGSRSGRTVSRQGVLYIFLNDSSRSADITVSAAGETALTAAAFQKAYQTATGKAGTSFYIQLVEAPSSGSLYVGRTANKTGTRLTDAAVKGRAFSCGSGAGETVSSLTYVPGAAASESIRYVASSAQGEFLYAGKITFTSSGTGTPAAASMVVKYTSAAAGVTFKSSDFETLPGATAAKLNLVSFTPPAAASGTLYYGRTAAAAGTAITSSGSWFSVSSTAIAGANTMNSVTFVPAAGSSGVVTIPFTALDTSGARVTGSVQITITSSAAVNPGTTSPAKPVKTFPDVPATEWYYTYVTDLATSGVLGGYEDGTFRPSEGVSLGQALKMIMIAAGYPDISGTGSNWAQPFLVQAKTDNLLPAGVSEDLNRLVSRYVIAEIAARAMKLTIPAAVTASPFSDMKTTDVSAPYVMALYNTGVIEGSEDTATKTMVYMGTMGIRRKEFAAIIWRMQNYVQTGNVNGTLG